MLPVPTHMMPFTDVCSTVSCWALILSVIFPPAHILALDLASSTTTTPTHSHQKGHHPYRISPSSAYSLTVYLDSTLHPFSASVSPPAPLPSSSSTSSLLLSSQVLSSEKCSAPPLRRVHCHTACAQGSVKRSHISTVLLPPSSQKRQEKVPPFPSSSPSTTTTPDASAQDNNQAQQQRPAAAADRQKMSDRNIIKKQTIYITNSERTEQIPHVRVSRGQIRRLIRHQSSTDRSSQQPQRKWSQILEIFWNKDTFQDTTSLHRHPRQQQPEQEEQQERHGHAHDSHLSDHNNNRNLITETEEEGWSGLWHGYVYPTGWNKSTFNNDLFPLSVSNYTFLAYFSTHLSWSFVRSVVLV